MTDLEAKLNRAKDLTDGNARSYQELCQAAGRDLGMDTRDTRMASLVDALESSGVWTKEQRMDFEIDFLEKVEQALNNFWDEFRKAKAESERPKLAVVKQPPAKLVDGNGRPLT